MNVDERGRVAGDELRQAFTGRDRFGAAVELERLHEERLRRARHQRRRAGLVAAAITVVAIVLLASVLRTRAPVVPANPVPAGTILYGRWDPQTRQVHWFTANADGSLVRDLGLDVTCARWVPGDNEILITNDAASGPREPLRPAIVDADGSGLRSLDAVDNRDLELGCGDVSPDGERIALEGFGRHGHHELDGIYTIRTRDGGDLVELLRGPVAPPTYSPDGSQLAFVDTSKEGVSPTGSGALFVMPADGSADPVRITPWGFTFGDHAWSPDGQWLVFQRPYGQLYLVHPDGSGIHPIPLQLPQGTGALNPSFSPDGTWIAFSLQRGSSSEIWVVRPDGTDLRPAITSPNASLQHPDWA